LSGGDGKPSPDERSEEHWVEAERQQFASELHDGLLPLLFAARMHAERLAATVEEPPWRQELTQLVDELAAAMDEGRRLLVDVHPPELVDGDWHQALAHYIAHGLPQAAGVVAGGNTASPRIELALDEATRTVPLAMAQTVYRIAQEALRNAVRHGQASQIRVRAAAGDDGWLLEIRDNGRGFDPDRIPPDRFGVRSMNARARRIGGSAQIESFAGEGTTVSLRLPPAGC
jgi:signal transduction histidine kinase